jgi:amino acid adenylation domain-containing protein
VVFVNSSNRSLISGFLASAERFPERPAVHVAKRPYSYSELRGIAASYAAALDGRAAPEAPPFTALLASRSIEQFAGILAILMRGHGYVPLNGSYPPVRTVGMIERSGCRAVIADVESSRVFPDVLPDVAAPLVVLIPELEDVSTLRARFPRHVFLGARDVAPAPSYVPRIADADAIAYVIFTSGSTGAPKGVTVAHRNVLAFIDYAAERWEVTENDRFSHTFSVTFDGSVLDMFTSWARGACICCPSQKELLNPGAFINRHQLTLWCSVPSLALFMKRFGSLKKGKFPSLRWSLFGAESLTVDIVDAWHDAAPGSRIDNVYGPTEAACVCLCYEWNPAASRNDIHRDLVPIGYPNPGMKTLVCDEALEEIAEGETGELLISGPQVCPGYLGDPDLTKKAFLVPPGRNDIYYRTGDLVVRPRGDRPLVYLGRIDNQIKVLGHRVELGEVEAAIRQETGIHGIVAFGWPLIPGGAESVEVFIEGASFDVADLKRRLAGRLPDFMVPKRFRPVAKIPLNENGKYDRRALQRILEAGE